MPLLSGNAAKHARTFCSDRDGEGCQMAPGKPKADGHPCSGPIVLDHADGRRDHNPQNGSNWQNLCMGHNRRKSKKAGPHRAKFTRHIDLRHSRQREFKRLRNSGTIRYMSGEMWKSEQAKPKVIEWIMNEIASQGALLVEEAVNSGAFMGNVDQGTVRKYIDTLTSKAGPLKRDFEGEDEYLYLKG